MARINSTQPYSDAQVDQLYQLLVQYEKEGKPQTYDILHNDLPLVPKTTNLDNFRNYEGIINDKTKSLIFRIHYPDTKDRNYDRYTFIFNNAQNNTPSLNGLSGIDGVDGLAGFIAKEVEKSKKEWDYEKLKKEHEDLNGWYTEQEAEIAELKQKLAEHENSSVIKNGLSSLGAVLESIGPDLVRKFTGMPMQPDPLNLGTLPADNANTVTAEEKGFIDFMNNAFTEAEKEIILNYVSSCVHDKSMLDLIR